MATAQTHPTATPIAACPCSKNDLDADLDSYFLKDKDVGAKHLDSELENYFKQRDAAKKVCSPALLPNALPSPLIGECMQRWSLHQKLCTQVGLDVMLIRVRSPCCYCGCCCCCHDPDAWGWCRDCGFMAGRCNVMSVEHTI